MQIYKNNNNTLNLLKETPFKLERDIQNLFEHNLTNLTGLLLVKSEFTIKNKRIDSLAYDEEAKAFVIIEYKRDKNYSVFDQGVTYLNLMLTNKAEFIVEYNEGLNKKLLRSDIDWSQSKVIFVSPNFTENQMSAVNFKDFPIELWQIRAFENGFISIDTLTKTADAPSISPLTQNNQQLTEIAKEVVVYSEEQHMEKADIEIQELYEKFKQGLLGLSSRFIIEPKKFYIGYRLEKKISDIQLLKKSLRIYINVKWGAINDTKGIARDVSNVGHFGSGDYEITIQDDKELEYILSLVKQIL